ncbi:MAG: lysophospholipase [Candidatus Thorarchaeota archaeon]
MKHEESEYVGYDGTRMFMQTWFPDEEPRAAVLGIHGLGSHSGLLAPMGVRFAERGYAFHAPDLRGFGRFDGRKGHVDTFAEFDEDIHCVVQDLKEVYPDKKLFLYGHSLGAVHVLSYTIKYDDLVDGALLICPAVSERLKVGAVTRALGRLLSALNVKTYIDNGLDLTLLARNKEVVERNQNDPLRVDKVTPRFAIEGLDTSKRVSKSGPRIHVPLIMQQGGSDQILIPEKSKEFFDSIASEDKTWKLYPDLYHEPFEDPGGDELLDDLFAWLDAHA